METPSRPELHAFVSESILGRLRVEREVEVAVDAVERVFHGSVRQVVPQSDPATRTVLVKVGLPHDAGLVNGLFRRLRVDYRKYEALVVPWPAVREVGQLSLMEVLDADGHPRRRFVTLGKRHKDLVEVLSGLKENEEAGGAGSLDQTINTTAGKVYMFTLNVNGFTGDADFEVALGLDVRGPITTDGTYTYYFVAVGALTTITLLPTGPGVAGDYFEIKFINPTWATNPLTTIFGGYIYID